MKKSLLALAILAVLFPSKASTELGTLRPVELVFLHREEEKLWVETDTGDHGSGADLEGALKDLRTAADGTVFLDTADCLLIAPDALDTMEELTVLLRPAAGVCLAKEKIDPSRAASWLRVHKPRCTLQDIRAGTGKPPTITVTEGRYRLEYPKN